MSSLPTIIYVDPDAGTGMMLAEHFEAAGEELHALADPDRLLAAARAVRPGLLLVRSESRGPVLARVLTLLGGDVHFDPLPIVLLCEDVTEHDWAKELRSGVIALQSMPEDPGQLIREVRGLWNGLGRRSGLASGTLDSPGLTALVEHLRRKQRSGVLTLNAEAPPVGRALFARGQLQSAQLGDLEGVEALLAMVAQPRAAFSFAQMGGETGEAVIDIELASVDEPLVAVEVGDVGTGEEEIPLEVPDGPPPIPILLVDDDEALCHMFSVLFIKHGFEVAVAADGFAGYEAARTGRYELIVADLNMPRMDGWGMLRLLREDFRTRELPVAFLSCHDDYRDTLRALNSGAQAYFSKSTRLDALAGQVQALLEPRAAAHQALAPGAAGAVEVQAGKVGPQWLLRELARRGLSGVLEVKDGWANYRVGLQDGVPTDALAQSGRHVAEGQRALTAFVASRAAEGTFTPGGPGLPPNLTGDLEAQLEQAVEVLNANERRLREGLLVQATDVNVNPDLYNLYAQVGPRAWLETARLICEEKLAPREVIARVEASPLDVEETLKDLVRRGVVTLNA